MNKKLLEFSSVFNIASLVLIYANGVRRKKFSMRRATISGMCNDFQNQGIFLVMQLINTVFIVAQTSSFLPFGVFFSLSECFRHAEYTFVHKFWAIVTVVFLILCIKLIVDRASATDYVMLPLLPMIASIFASFKSKNSLAMGVSEVGFLLVSQSLVLDLIT